MPNQQDIVNMAVSHLGAGKEVVNIETENSEPARAGRRFYETARLKTLRDGQWPFATRLEALALVEAAPTTEWAYSYRYPTKCLFVRRIPSGVRNDSRASRIPYKLYSDDQGTLIYTDAASAEIEYTYDMDNHQFYPPDFVLAFSYYLAHLMAPRVTGGDRFKLGDKTLGLYLAEIGNALARAHNEEQNEEEPDVDYISTRQ